MNSYLQIAIFFGVTAIGSIAAAADTCQPARWKQGWDAQVVETYSQGCTTSFVENTNRTRSQNGMATLSAIEIKPFRDATKLMCKCLTERLANTGSYTEVQVDYAQRLQVLVREANSGGQCSQPVLEGFALLRSLLK